MSLQQDIKKDLYRFIESVLSHAALDGLSVEKLETAQSEPLFYLGKRRGEDGKVESGTID